MQTRILIALLCAGAAAGSAVAETILVNDQVQVRASQVDRPKGGVTMSEVEKRFGAPLNRHPTVGQPPITRWDYNGFSGFFAHDPLIPSLPPGACPPPHSAPRLPEP